jgi:hypothetical protein
MKESKSLETLFDKVTKSKLPDWVKIVLTLAIFTSPLLEMLSKWLLFKQATDFIAKLLGL